MKDFRLKKWMPGLLLFLLTAVVCWLYVLRFGVFGSKVDWISQHSVLPDYFRQQFYETGNLLPEFALHLGGGQNLYHFAYYGLYSPMVLLSYLFPFMEMQDYLMCAQFFCLAASVELLYVWLWKRGFPVWTAFGAAALYLLAGPMIFHSYNQIMFVNYMPFLCLGFLGVDRYFAWNPANPAEKMSGAETYVSQKSAGRVRSAFGYAGEKITNRRRGLLLISIILMILTSFYFSIGGMLVLVLYGLHRCLEVYEEQGKHLTLRNFLAEGFAFAVPFLLAVLCCGFFLVPTAMTLVGRGGDTSAEISLKELLLPAVSLDRMLYTPYGIGLPTIGITAISASLFARRSSQRILAWCCAVILTVPVFAYLLNGGLYIRDKVMIPFLPLLCYLIACYVREMGASLLPWLVPLLLIGLGWRKGDVGAYAPFLLLDTVLMLLCNLWICRSYGKKQKRFKRLSFSFLLVPPVLFLGLYGMVLHPQADRMLDREFYAGILDADVQDLITEVTEKDEGFYRTEQWGNTEENAANLNRIWNENQYVSSLYSSSYHADYLEFRRQEFQLEEPFRNFLMQSAVQNPVYLDFMGVKYFVSKNTLPGYRCVASQGEWKVYENEDAFPMAYVTERTMSETEYRRLMFPYCQLALLEYTVIEDPAGNNEGRNGGENGNDTENLESGQAVGGREERFERSDSDRPSDLTEWKSKVKTVELDFPEQIEAEKKQTVQIDISYEEAEKQRGEYEKGEQKKAEQEKEEQEKEGTGEGERVLFLQFQVENQKPNQDVSISVEGTRNKLTAKNHIYYNGNTTFSYAVPLAEGQEEISVRFGKGKYRITDVQCWAAKLSETGEQTADMENAGKKEKIEDSGSAEHILVQSAFTADRKKTKGNRIAGEIRVKNAGYFVTSIPYEESFEILVDGRRVKGEKVNTAFLGFEIGEGEHTVEIIFHAPGVCAGRWISLAGVLLVLFLAGCSTWRQFWGSRDRGRNF